MKRLRITIFALLAFSLVLLVVSSGVRLLIKDRTLPVIECPQQELRVSAKDGSDALLQGVTASDGKDGDLTDSIVVEQITGTGTAGKVTVTYAVADRDHHVASCSRTVIYTDYVPPRFSLSRPLIYDIGENLQVRDRLGATDMIDGSLTDRIKINASSFSTSYAGTFPITMEVTNSLGDTSTLTLDVVVRDSERGAPEIKLKQYLVYQKQGAEFDASAYVDSVMGGETYNVTASVPDGGLHPVVNQVTYSCMNSMGLTGTTALYVIVE